MSTFDNYSFRKVKEKMDKGQFLSGVERQYFEDEAQNVANQIMSRYGKSGPEFVSQVIYKLHALNSASQPKEQPVEEAPKQDRGIWGDE